MELLDVVDEKGNPTGKTVERIEAHSKGICHRTSHVWLARNKSDKLQVLIQKRSDDKDSHPGCYDISSAGHIPAGIDYLDSAIRELKEELGVDAAKEEFIYCGTRRIHSTNVFYDRKFVDNQVSNVYLVWKDIDEEDFIVQKEEISSVKWIELDELTRCVNDNLIPNCIALEELNLLYCKLDKELHI